MEVFCYPSFLRQIKKLPVSVRQAAIVQTKKFVLDPRDPTIKFHKLTGRLSGYWSFSVDQRHRIVLEVNGQQAIFHWVGDHRIYDV